MKGWMIEGKERREMKPLLLKLGVAFAISLAGYLYSHIKTRINPPPPPSTGKAQTSRRESGGLKEELQILNSSTTSTPLKHEEQARKLDNAGFSPCSKSSGDEEGFLLPEFNEIVLREFGVAETNLGSSCIPQAKDGNTKRADSKEEMGFEQEICRLRNLVRVLRERERSLEIQLLEYYGLKEEETAVRELQNRLKINSMEAKLFSLKVESLQAENRRLQAQASDYSRVMAEVESARAKIRLLKKKIRVNAEQAKDQLSVMKQRVEMLQARELEASKNDQETVKKLHMLRDLEDQIMESRRENARLQHENSELMLRIESAEALASTCLADPEVGATEEASLLREKNENLAKELERLQTDRYADVEELVYLRWVNACLRYELRNYQPTPGKTVARDLSKSLSPNSEEKAKQLIIEYAGTGIEDKMVSLDFDSGDCSSSSTLTETCEFDDSSLDSPSGRQSNSGKTKSKFFNKLKKLVRGKDWSREPSIERASTSCGASERGGSLSVASLDEIMGTNSGESAISCITGERVQLEGTIVNNKPKRATCRSQSMSLPSLEIDRQRKLSLDDMRAFTSKLGNVDANPGYGVDRSKSVGFYDSSVMGIHQSDHMDHDAIARERLELKKFAQVLKNSHRASFS
ncbi:protein CHUP1, chloroplastic [Amborella trichopoda]|nr:protein CHUP1, chloroplastic [Amborella trichopoda]|eukprot:XP_006826759.2 protein CHUP1, chloroplastic [Amborella trichopoda]